MMTFVLPADFLAHESVSMELKNSLQDSWQNFSRQLESCLKLNDVLDLKSHFIGKDGPITNEMKNLKAMEPTLRALVGPILNQLKSAIEESTLLKIKALELQEINEKLLSQKKDHTYLEQMQDMGLRAAGLHPVTLVQREIEDIFTSMGFEILDGPHIEDEWHNFTALNIPEDHPARDMQDTFWFSDKIHLLRTHTSTIQVRGMAQRKPPFKFIGPGKVFRAERTDATHEMCFHQLEGMMVGEKVSVGHLIHFMKTLLKEIFKKDMEIRLRPGFFPFVEPGFELDIRWKKPDVKKGESPHSGWLELLPCGMVHPEVLRMGGIDPEKYSGFAFGLGLDRLVMVRYGIDDVRHLHSADLRFGEQFKTF